MSARTSDTNLKFLSDYVSKTEVAEAFGVSERTIERWVRLRAIPKPVKLGRLSLFHIPTIRTHLDSQTVNSAATLRPAHGKRR